MATRRTRTRRAADSMSFDYAQVRELTRAVILQTLTRLVAFRAASQWAGKALKEKDRKALSDYFDGEVPELDDMKLLVKAEMAGSMKPLTLNRVWKAVQALVNPGGGSAGADPEVVRRLRTELVEAKQRTKVALASKEGIYNEMMRLQQMYGNAVRQIEALKTNLRKYGAGAVDTKEAIWYGVSLVYRCFFLSFPHISCAYLTVFRATHAGCPRKTHLQT